MFPANPFRVGKVVQRPNFIGRADEIRSLCSRITNAESVAVVGEPHVGKTSLLHYLADPATRREHRLVPGRWAFVRRNGFDLPADTTPATFWQSALAEALSEWNDVELTAELGPRLQAGGFSAAFLEAAFAQIQRNGGRLVLLLDELEMLLGHAGLARMEFWGTLRTLASTSRALCYVSASRADLIRLNDLAEKLKPQPGGSPLFNIARELRLRPFPEAEAQQLLDLDREACLTPRDRRVILSLAGRHPYLLQQAASLLWEARASGRRLAEDEYLSFAHDLVEAAGLHFADMWRHLGESEGAQTLALMFTLQDIDLGTHRLSELESLTRVFSRQLAALTEAGVLEHIPPGRYRLAGGAFAIWVARNQISRSLPDPARWLRENEKLIGPLTRGDLSKVRTFLGDLSGSVKDPMIDLGTMMARRWLGLP